MRMAGRPASNVGPGRVRMQRRPEIGSSRGGERLKEVDVGRLVEIADEQTRAGKGIDVRHDLVKVARAWS